METPHTKAMGYSKNNNQREVIAINACIKMKQNKKTSNNSSLHLKELGEKHQANQNWLKERNNTTQSTHK